MTSVSFKPFTLVTACMGLLAAWSCTVVSKSDYTFTDNPGEGGASANGGSGGGGGKGGRGGSGGLKGGSSGTGGRAGGGPSTGAGKGGGAGVGGLSGAAGESGANAVGGKGGSAGTGPLSKGGRGGRSPLGNGGEGGVTDPCDSNPCVHGTCSTKGDTYSCACTNGYTGVRCQTNIDDCAMDPCLNGGTCFDGVADYRCDCNGTGYSGKNCDTAGPCVVNPCLHGGVCTDTGGGNHTCDCRNTGFEDVDCTVNHDDCPTRGCNEDEGGTCVDQVNGYTCSYQKSCGAVYNAGNTRPGPYWIDRDGGDPGNAEETYCYYGYNFNKLGFGIHGTSYGNNWAEAYAVDTQGDLHNAFFWLYDHQGGVINVAGGISGIGYCCFRDPAGGIVPPGTSSFLTLAKVSYPGSYDCEQNYPDSLMYLFQYNYPNHVPGPVPLVSTFTDGWYSDSSDTATCSKTGVTLGLFWNYYSDP